MATDQVLEPVATFANDGGQLFTLFEARGGGRRGAGRPVTVGSHDGGRRGRRITV